MCLCIKKEDFDKGLLSGGEEMLQPYHVPAVQKGNKILIKVALSGGEDFIWGRRNGNISRVKSSVKREEKVRSHSPKGG